MYRARSGGVLLPIAVQVFFWWSLDLSLGGWLACYAAFAVNWSALQYADHAGMARAFNMHAERVERADDLPAAIERALANRPALLDVIVTPEAEASDAKSGLAWVPDLQAIAAWEGAEIAWRAKR